MKQPFKKWIYFSLFLVASNLDAGDSLDKAGELYQATLYSEAIPFYEKQLVITGELPKDRQLELIYSYYFTNQYSKLINFTKKFPSIEIDALYLKTKAHRQLKQFPEAVSTIQPYSKQFPDKGELELGLIYFEWNKFGESKQHLEKTNSILASLYLARIAIHEEYFDQAEQRLKNLARVLADDHPLFYALSFLHGEIFYRKEDYAKAAVYFEQALPKKNQKNSIWYADTLYQLGWSYLKVGDRPDQLKKVKKKYFIKAEDSFLELIEFENSERVTLALAQAQMIRGRQLGDSKALKRAETLLDDEDSLHAYILKAEISTDYKKRERLYEKITHPSNKESPFYGKGWYLRGLNELNEGKGHLKEAAAYFETAFTLLYPQNKQNAALALKYQAEALASSGRKEGNLKALSLLNELLNQFREELLPHLEEPGEIYYLHGLIASRLFEEDHEIAFFEIAQKSLIEGTEKYPRGKHQVPSLKTLGILYYSNKSNEKAEEVFKKIAEQFPQSDQAGEALFWAAIAAPSIEKEKELLRQVYEGYPNSPYADEAYFRIYTYEEYLNGKQETIQHLSHFNERFPNTPYLILTDYLSGLYFLKNNSEKGRLLLKQVELTYTRLSNNGSIPEEKRKYFSSIRQRALLERGESLFKEGQYREAEEILSKVFDEHKNQSNSIMQESGYWLTKNFRALDEIVSAQKVIDLMIKKFKSQKMTRGYYLSRIWYEDGMIAMKLHDRDKALKSLLLAEEAAKGRVLGTEELLDLWIQQSLCYRELKMMDQAMLILSRVINYDAISSLRLNAMYLRAKIYELQGRRELARKQLDAIASKGGDWAQKAKQKLEENYEYQ